MNKKYIVSGLVGLTTIGAFSTCLLPKNSLVKALDANGNLTVTLDENNRFVPVSNDRYDWNNFDTQECVATNPNNPAGLSGFIFTGNVATWDYSDIEDPWEGGTGNLAHFVAGSYGFRAHIGFLFRVAGLRKIEFTCDFSYTGTIPTVYAFVGPQSTSYGVTQTIGVPEKYMVHITNPGTYSVDVDMEDYLYLGNFDEKSEYWDREVMLEVNITQSDIEYFDFKSITLTYNYAECVETLNW